MSYLPVPSLPRNECLNAAKRRLDALRALNSGLEPAIDLQQRLLEQIALIADALASAPLPRLSLPSRYLAAKLGRGVPALAGEPIPLPVALLKVPLLSLCDALAS